MILTWKYIDESYLDWIRKNYEKRIPYTNYGQDKMKPFFGSLFKIGDLIYVTQISSPKDRHNKLKNSLDFCKIYHPFGNNLIGVVNLNFMFPVHKDLVVDLVYSDLDKYIKFNNMSEKSRYIDLLKIEIKEINKMNVSKDAKKLYNLKLKNPSNAVSKRCFNFKNLEMACVSYIEQRN